MYAALAGRGKVWMRINGVTEYFERTRVNHPLATEEVARRIAESSHSVVFPPRRFDGRVEVFGYHPRIKLWFMVIVIPGGQLIQNAFLEVDYKDEIRNRARKLRWI